MQQMVTLSYLFKELLKSVGTIAHYVGALVY